MSHFLVLLLPLCFLSMVEISKAGPISVKASEVWERGEGTWSSFQLQIGASPEIQSVRVLPSTSLPHTLVVASLGCPSDFPGGVAACEKSRGGLYSQDSSSTWKNLSLASNANNTYNFGDFQIFTNYGFENQPVLMGRETVSFGFPGPKMPVAEGNIIGQIADWNYTLQGLLGLDPRPGNFSELGGFNDPQKSLMQILKDKKAIPSLSYGYTAGANYAGTRGVWGSLTLGGYDSSRVTGSAKASFPFFEEVETRLVVQIASIVADVNNTPTILNNSSLLTSNSTSISPKNSLSAIIDSSLPFIYLPTALCKVIEDMFQLTWDNTSEYYLVNDSTYNFLQQRNASLQFNLINDGLQNINITLPYNALIHPLDYPYASKSTRFVPLRPVADPRRSLLGRAFLQEAYLTVDYERSKFTVQQAAFPSTGVSKHIVPIPLGDKSTRLTSPTIVGSTVGLVVLLVLVYIASCLFRRSRQRRRRASDEATMSEKLAELESSTVLPKAFASKELDSNAVHEVDSSTPPQEIGDSGIPVISEMPDDTLSSAYAGFFKKVEADSAIPEAKVYYEMDATPLTSDRSTTSTTLSSGETLVGSSENGSTPQRSQQIPAELSPIPQTPIELYGPTTTPETMAQRDWVGQAPGLPRVIMTPATQESPRQKTLRDGGGCGDTLTNAKDQD